MGNSGATTATARINGYQFIETIKLQKIERKSCIELVREQELTRWATGIMATE